MQLYNHAWKLVEECSKDDSIISLVRQLTHLPTEVLNERGFSYVFMNISKLSNISCFRIRSCYDFSSVSIQIGDKQMLTNNFNLSLDMTISNPSFLFVHPLDILYDLKHPLQKGLWNDSVNWSVRAAWKCWIVLTQLFE